MLSEDHDDRVERSAARVLRAIAIDEDIDSIGRPDDGTGFAADGELMVAATALQAQLRQARARLEVQSALLDVANELADNDADSDRTLRAIVDRTLSYFKCDLAYLTVNDFDEHETWVAYTAGDAKVPTRIPFGTGIGGRVASTGQPFSTRDYLTDDRIVHVPHVDATIAATRQRAVMAAPLVYDGRVVGVLHASNKTPTEFTADEVELLEAFAGFAAVASERSRLVSELRTANSALERQGAVVRRSINAHEHAMDVILRGGGLQDVIDGATEFLGGHLAILDLESHPVAHSRDTAPETVERMTRSPSENTRQIRRVALQAGEEILGSLVWCPPQTTEVSEPDVRLFERTAVIASLLLLFQKHLTDAETQVRGELVTDLLSATGIPLDTIRERARRVGFQLSGPLVVLTVDAPDAGRGRLSSALGEVAARGGGLSGTYEGVAVAVVPAGNASHAAAEQSPVLMAKVGTPVTIGASSVIADPADLHRGFTEARSCLLALQRLGRVGQHASVADMGYVGLLIGGGTSAGDFVVRTLGPIIDHDDRRGSGLVDTLDVYFGCGQSLAVSAEQLHVHTNTVTQRLTRCKHLLGVDFHDPMAMLDIQLALRLVKMGVVIRVTSS